MQSSFSKKIVAGNQNVAYIYSASGEKLAANANGSLTYYRSVMVYGNDNMLLYLLTPEGTVSCTNGAYTYNYFKKDQVGSTRVMLSAVGGTLQQQQTTDYYPFGLAHATNNLNKNKILFSGKELQDATVGGAMLGLYDFGARSFDPMIGRWTTIDPLARKYVDLSPYNYCTNNPVNLTDPWGLEPRKDSTNNKMSGVDNFQMIDEVLVRGYRPSQGSWSLTPYESPYLKYNAEQKVAWENQIEYSYDIPWEEGYSGGGSSSQNDGNNPPKAPGSFPVNRLTDSYKNRAGYGYFGANRSNGARKHAGVDFYGKLGDPVYAILRGIVLARSQQPFLPNTSLYSIVIDHGIFIGRYCEIYSIPNFNVGDMIQEGQFLGKMGQYQNESPMLHFEMYDGSESGPLTDRNNLPYQRRGDLINPTTYINKLIK